MGRSVTRGSPPVVLVCGGDEFLVKEEARRWHDRWRAESGGVDDEIIDGAAGNAGEALRSIGRLREALQTLPMFGSGKVVWWRDCSFLGEDRTSAVAAVTDALADLAKELEAFRWDKVRLLISGAKVDKRRVLFKVVERIGRIETCGALSADDRDWPERAGALVSARLESMGKTIGEEALAEFVEAVGPDAAQLQSEADKVGTYVGDRPRVERSDVDRVVTRNRRARAFALGDALGDRDLPRLLRRLDEELWEASRDRDRSEIGVLYGLIAKVRALLLGRELLDRGMVRAETEYGRFKPQWERLPAEAFASDKRYNPRAMNPYVVFRAVQQARHYTAAELVRAMGRLLECNRLLVSSGSDSRLILQRALVAVVARRD